MAKSDVWRGRRSSDPATAINEIKADTINVLKMTLEDGTEKIIEVRWHGEKFTPAVDREYVMLDALPLKEEKYPIDGEAIDVIIGDALTQAGIRNYSYEADSQEMRLIQEFQEQSRVQKETEQELAGSRGYHEARRDFYNPESVGRKYIEEFVDTFDEEKPIDLKSWARFFGACELNLRQNGVDPEEVVDNATLKKRVHQIKGLLEDSDNAKSTRERKTIGREILSRLMAWAEEQGGAPDANGSDGQGGGDEMENKMPSQGQDKILQGESQGQDHQIDQDTLEQASDQPGAPQSTADEKQDEGEKIKSLGAGGGGEYTVHHPTHSQYRVDGSSLARELTKIFNVKDRKRTRYFHGTEEGKISPRRLHRIGAGKNTVFKKKEILSVPDSFVFLLVDGSGSMTGHPFELVARICDAFRRSFNERPGYKAVGFSYSGGYPNSTLERLFDINEPDPKWVMDGGGTPSAGALAYARDYMKIAAARTRDRIIIHFTDGMPNDISGANEEIRRLANMGVKIITITTNDYYLDAYDRDISTNVYVPSFEEAASYLRKKIPAVIT